MRKNLPADLSAGGSVLIAAISGRALAASALRSGLVPLVADFFADADTRALADACRKVDGPISEGFRNAALLDALENLAQSSVRPVLGCVAGPGFEDRPELLSRIQERWPLLGNDEAAVAAVKNPARLLSALETLAIPHPQTHLKRPGTRGTWLAKLQGGAGGSHIAYASPKVHRRNCYYQRHVEGGSISALFVGNGLEARVLGFSHQWTSPAPRQKFRYGGAARPASISEPAQQQMMDAVTKLAPAFRLRGLCSADFIVAKDKVWLLEINPRPGATLDIFDSDEAPLLALHLAAVLDGRLPLDFLHLPRAAASATLHAPHNLRVPAGLRWPRWVLDRPSCRERIDKQRPICTVVARARTAAGAKRLIETRTRSILAALRSGQEGNRRERQFARESGAGDRLA